MTAQERQEALLRYQEESRTGRLGQGFASLQCCRCKAFDKLMPMDGDMMVCDECGAKQMVPVSIRSAYAGLWKENL